MICRLAIFKLLEKISIEKLAVLINTLKLVQFFRAEVLIKPDSQSLALADIDGTYEFRDQSHTWKNMPTTAKIQFILKT